MNSILSILFHSPVAGIALDASLKAFVLLLMAAIAAALLKNASASVRHRIWCMAFSGVVLLPVLSVALPRWNVGVLPSDARSGSFSTAFVGLPATAQPDAADRDEFPDVRTGVPSAAQLNSRDVEPTIPEAWATGEQATAGSTLANRQRKSAPTDDRSRIRSAETWILFGWGMGATILLVPLLVGAAALRLLFSNCRPVKNGAWNDLLPELCNKLRLKRRVQLLETEEAIIPVTWGVFCPVVLVPEESQHWANDRRRFVLLHELAHIKRLDVLFQIIARVACGLYWFNPLVWYALRRLRIERELACDDCVVGVGAKASDYATQLVELARAYRPLRLTIAVSMARSSSLEERVASLLDRARAHGPLTRKIATLLAVTAAALVTVTAVFRPVEIASGGVRAAADGERPDGNVDKNGSGEKDSLVAETQPQSDAFEYSGTVTDVEGKPLEGAQVYLEYVPSGTWEFIPKMKTGADGRFQFRARKSDFDATHRDEPWRTASVAVTAEGYGPAYVRAAIPLPTTNLALKLPRDDLPITGQVVDLEGRPIVGVEIKVGWVHAAQDKDGIPMPFDAAHGGERNVWSIGEPLPSAPIVKTDDTGRFALRGIGRERMVELGFVEPTIENVWVEATTRPGELQRLGGTGMVMEGGPYKLRYGAPFVHVAAPSRPIVGVVRDEETGQPLAGVSVSRDFTQSNEPHAADTTNDRGEFRLTGLSRRIHEIHATPPSALPYFSRSVPCSSQGAQTDPVKLEIKLRRGITVTGRLVDQMGKPARGSVNYFPLRTNPYIKEFADALSVAKTGLTRSPEYPSSYSEADGGFRIPVIPGPGLLLVQSAHYGLHITPVPLKLRAADRERKLLDEKDPLVFATLPQAQVLSEFHAYQFLDLKPNDNGQRFDLSIDFGSEIQGQVVDSTGKPLPGVVATGTTQYQLTDDGKFIARGLAPDAPRILCFYHKDRNLAVHYRTTGDEKGAVRVTLAPCGAITGQVVDAEGKPLAGVQFNLLYVEADGIPRMMFPGGLRILTSEEQSRMDKMTGGEGRTTYGSEPTDKNGRFTLAGLVPDLKFRLVALTAPGFQRVRLTDTSVSANKTVDLGTIKVAAESAPGQRAAAEPPAAIAEAPPAATKANDRGPEIDAAIARLRDLGAFVREFHPRDNPQYWVQIISTGMWPQARREAENFDDEALNDVEIIGRGVAVDLHLRHTSITSAGLGRLVSAGKFSALELTGSNVDDALLKVLPKLPLQGQLGLDSDELTDDGIKPLAACRQLVSVSLKGRLLTDDCLEHLTGLPNLEGVSLGYNFTAAACAILARLENLKDLDVSSQATPQLSDFTKFPKLRKLSLSGKEHDDETALTIANSFKSLEQAYLRKTSITNAGVQHLSRLEKLKTLTLDGAPLDDDIADSIRRMKQLGFLSLNGCAVGDATIAAVAECSELWFLSLSDTLVSDEGLAELIKLKKLHVLYLSSCKGVTDDGIKSLMRLPTSKEQNLLLNVQLSGITEEAARELQGALPHAQIVWGVPPVPLR